MFGTSNARISAYESPLRASIGDTASINSTLFAIALLVIFLAYFTPEIVHARYIISLGGNNIDMSLPNYHPVEFLVYFCIFKDLEKRLVPCSPMYGQIN